MKKTILVSSISMATLLLSGTALADDPTGAPSKPAEAKPAEAKKDEAPAAAAAGGEEVRLRIGFNFGAGPLLGDISGLNLGAGFRVGAQFNRLLGAYVQTGGTALVGFGGASASAIAFVPISPMASITPIDQIELAAGPSLDYYSGGTVTSTTAGGSTGSFAFGIAGRAALHLGGRNETTGRRSGFAIGLDIHPIFAGGGVVVPMTIGLGGDWL
ncbi:MAG: hypothetical protein U0174_13695 [Polyangiaceae bacterium]